MATLTKHDRLNEFKLAFISHNSNDSAVRFTRFVFDIQTELPLKLNQPESLTKLSAFRYSRSLDCVNRRDVREKAPNRFLTFYQPPLQSVHGKQAVP